MSQIEHIPLGITAVFPCSYLPQRQERLLVAGEPLDVSQFSQLVALGFRRSGDQVYRPHCPGCQACQPLKVPVATFRPSRSQRRVLAKNRDLHWRVVMQPKPYHRPLYHHYIRGRHADGAMSPPSDSQFDRFIPCRWLDILYLEAWLDGELLVVAATDLLTDALSATYTFFHPGYPARSLGVRAILAQLQLAKQLGRNYLYLGYQIDACGNMAYKRNFQPAQHFDGVSWRPYRG
ncbi:arginyltransferase [Ferrimonas gelatinilytica]|uniref:Aspartate/glutamate leucyltransferase n=1 Tax=Ferrimonas gelatinilytica TaxID=1255257 RepID=A0ABP9RVR8_9GAMM